MAVTVKQEFRFGPFFLDVHSGELYREGSKVKVQPQPIQVLTILLEHPGELLTRDEIRSRIWPSDTFVDFENGLNTAVRKLRQALGDESDIPKYIETLPRRGYRFIARLDDENQDVNGIN
jgi:DNA-binding winged helix-turn-helix (wHTH) protein